MVWLSPMFVKILSLLFISYQAAQAAPSALEIMQKNEEARKLPSLKSSAVLVTGDQSKTSKKEFTWWRKLAGDDRFNTLTRFQAPATIKGQGILFLEHKAGENEVLLYLPAFKKVRRVENQQQSSSFMGSEFSYSDITAQHLDDYKYKILGNEKCINDAKVFCFLIESTPASLMIQERTNYSKVISWVRSDNFMIEKSEYYDLKNEIFKRLVASNIKEIDSKNHKWFTHFIRMDQIKLNRFTTLEFKTLQKDENVPDSYFTVNYLSSER